MEHGSGLVATLLAHTQARLVPPTEAEAAALEALLVRAWEDGRARWPGVALPAGRFVTHLAQRLSEAGPGGPIPALLEDLSLEELYLACACLEGMASAHEAFERSYLAQLPAKLRGLRQPEALVDDVCQLTRVKLLVATPESAPKIGKYTGKGALLSWVVVTAVRIANKLRESGKPMPEEDPEELIKMLPGQGVDPELDTMKRRHQADFLQALHEAAVTLSAHERHLLRLHFADKLSTYELASLFRVNQSTVSRWLKSARQQVYEETLRRLKERLGLSTLGIKSFLGLVDSQLDLRISQLLDEKRVLLPPRDDEDD